MISHRSADLDKSIREVDLISTDVFDTLLLRTFRSERSRTARAERLFSEFLEARGRRIDPASLITARYEAQRLAFRALAIRGAGEIRLVDIVARQLRLLGLPPALVDTRVQFETQVEKSSLRVNLRLADFLRERRRSGTRVVAISDTTLSGEAIRELIGHFHAEALLDAIYTSADYGCTKRKGELFTQVSKIEGVAFDKIAHIGDDPLADSHVPAALGMKTVHAARPRWSMIGRKANGAVIEARSHLSRRKRLDLAKAKGVPAEDGYGFAREVLGPIVTQFCLLIWLYASEVEAKDRATLLFCARGGVGIREAFERVLAKLQLPLRLRRHNLMISRLVAARSAILARSPAALEELSREFRGDSFRDVATAVGGRAYELPAEWHHPFAADDFLKLLFGPSGQEVLRDILTQNALFVRHFAQCRGDADRVVLCDTGLYGSTQRLLASAFPELRIESVQFARSNYKGHGEEHFPKIAGLLVQRNFYSAFDVRSCVLRYWHLIESLFEPQIASVRTFAQDADGVRGNCGDIRFGAVDPSRGNGLLSGALAYIDALAPDGGAVALRDAELAWFRLKRAITRPTSGELQCLEVKDRSVDFGRSDFVRVLPRGQRRPMLTKLRSLKSELWREGAIAREFPLLKHALLPMLESAYSLRGVLARQH